MDGHMKPSLFARTKVMIVCSCNVFSDHQVRSTLANTTQSLRMSQVYDYLGGSVRCGRCAHTIKRIMEEMNKCAVNPVAAMRACTLPNHGVSITSPGGPVIDVRSTGT
jgi:bacterioferritin-associated ferredoxin